MKHKATWYYRHANDKNRHLLTNYKKSLQYNNINEDTIRSYMKNVYNWMLYLQDKDIDVLEATVENLVEYLDSLDVSNTRRDIILVSLNRFYTLNKKNGKAKVNIIQKYRTDKQFK